MFKKLYKLFYLITHEQYYGFVQGHSYLTEENILMLSNMVKNFNSYEQIIKRYENEFTSLIGTGYGLSFAAGRMAFYSLMKVLNIGQGDEVILQGSTCSVMPNAVLRTGAKPVFADIDKDTFGSSAAEIEKKITPNTKLIVAQHSFGIPCKIDEIVALGRRENIFVLEDCAISFDSSIDGKKVGNWGDAAIFSTDHSKPINTLIGGFLYTKSKELYYKIQNYQENIPNLKSAHQKRLFNQLLWERKFYNPPKYAYGIVLNILKRKLFSRNNAFTFLEADYSNNPSDEN
jgi:perosamine synthetase